MIYVWYVLLDRYYMSVSLSILKKNKILINLNFWKMGLKNYPSGMIIIIYIMKVVKSHVM